VLLGKYAYELKAAGLSRVTISLDSLDQDVFARMNGGMGNVDDVLSGIQHALDAGLGPIKINAVIQRGVNEDSVLPLVDHFRGTGITVRFIEYMWRSPSMPAKWPAATASTTARARWASSPR
jgi:cyclic pyranopterin phosphate synthase